MAPPKFVALLGSVEVTSANNTVIINEGASDLTATIASGTYYLKGDGSADDLAQAIEDALNAAGAFTYVVALEYTTDPTLSGKTASNVVISTSPANTFALKWGAGLFDGELLGYAGTNLSGATSYTAPSSAQLSWVSTEPVHSREPDPESDVAQHVTPDGQTYTFRSGGPRTRRTITFSVVDERRVLKERNTADEAETYEKWWERYQLGYPLQVHLVAESSAGYLSGPSSSTLLETMVLDEESCKAIVGKQRREDGQAYYSWRVGLRGYVS